MVRGALTAVYVSAENVMVLGSTDDTTDRDVHKVPALEFVGWFTLCPESGPTPALVSIHKQIMFSINESALLLAFHPSAISPANASNSNGKLPLTIYESSIESDQAKGDGAMQIDGEDGLALKFHPLPYTIETDETEMIAIDYVAKGAGSAAAVHVEGESAPETKEQPDRKGKKRAEGSSDSTSGEKAEGAETAANPLSIEEEDQIAGITTRLNSVRMLQSRLSLLSKFIRSQPHSYLADPETPLSKESPGPAQLPHLRNIQALLTRLSLLTPSATGGADTTPSAVADSLTSAALSQSNDVALTSLLSILGQDIQGMSDLGRKFAAVESQKASKGKGKGGFGAIGGGPLGGGGDFDISMGGNSMMV